MWRGCLPLSAVSVGSLAGRAGVAAGFGAGVAAGFGAGVAAGGGRAFGGGADLDRSNSTHFLRVVLVSTNIGSAYGDRPFHLCPLVSS